MEENRAKRYFEWLISGLLIGGVLLILFSKLNQLALSVERESIQQTLSTVRMGVQIFIFKNMIEGKHRDLRSYENMNPIEMLGHPPENYAGAYSAAQSTEVPSGRWYFDLSSRELVYRMTYLLFGDASGKTELRYRLILVLKTGNQGGVTDGNENFNLSLLQVEGKRDTTVH
jgi:hypothetical protein